MPSRFITIKKNCQRVVWFMAPLALAACGNSGGSHDASQVVAKVNDAEISVHQINYVLQRQPGLQPDQVEPASKEILDRLIDQEFAVQKAVKLKIDRDPAVMQALAAARRDVLARAYTSRVADSAAKPESNDIRSYYDAHPEVFAKRKIYQLQELVVQADEKQTAELRERVRVAKTMGEVADYLKSKGLPARANQSTQAAETLPANIVKHLATIKDGQAMMMPTQGGARLIFLSASRAAPLTLEQATPAITQALIAERRREAVAKDMKTLRDAGQVKYVGKFAVAMNKPASAATPTPSPAPAPAPLPSTSPASGADVGSVDAATMRKGLSGLN